jgi:hypothetical protein
VSVPFSKLKPADKFAAKWAEHGLAGGEPETEYLFDPERKWRFDFAWPTLHVAVEIDGFGYGHQAQQCLAKSNEKQNAAVESGWIVLRYNSRQLGSHGATEDAVRQVCRVLMDAGRTGGTSPAVPR